MGIRKKKSVIDQAIDQATEFAESVRPQIESALVTAREKAGPALADARERAVELSAEAREKAAPLLADARERAVELSAEAREKATPLIAEGRTKAAAGAAVGAAYAAEKAAHGKELAATKIAELKAEPEPEPKGGKLRKIVLFGALAAIAGFVAKKLTGDKSADNWQSSYTPTPPAQTAAPVTPASPVSTAAAAVEEDDRAAASPDEALSDATDEPHAPTTPDAPAEVIDIDPDNRA